MSSVKKVTDPPHHELVLSEPIQVGERKIERFYSGMGIEASWAPSGQYPTCLELRIHAGQDEKGLDCIDVHTIPMHKVVRLQALRMRVTRVAPVGRPPLIIGGNGKG